MHHRNAVISALGLSLLVFSTAAAVGAHAGETARAYALAETETWDIEAEHGETYRIYVSKPAGDAPADGFPVLYVLDGNAMFAGFAEARRIQGVYDDGFEQMIVVGIGYPNDELYDGRRLGDFTPPIGNPILRDLYKEYPSGKRDLFEAFLMQKLRPEISRRYSVNALRESLYGHSLGGLFDLHMVYTSPGTFHTVIAASPSIWWDDQFILAEERDFRSRLEEDPSLGAGVRVSILVGELEEAAVTVTDSEALAERLRELSSFGVRSSYHLLDNETHITVPSRSVTIALRAVMQWP